MDSSLICPQCRYETALVHEQQWVELACPGCGTSIAGDSKVSVVEQALPASDEDLDRWIASYQSRMEGPPAESP